MYRNLLLLIKMSLNIFRYFYILLYYFFLFYYINPFNIFIYRHIKMLLLFVCAYILYIQLSIFTARCMKCRSHRIKIDSYDLTSFAQVHENLHFGHGLPPSLFSHPLSIAQPVPAVRFRLREHSGGPNTLNGKQNVGRIIARGKKNIRKKSALIAPTVSCESNRSFRLPPFLLSQW